METLFGNTLLGKEIQVRCVEGTVYEGKLRGVGGGIATLEWEGKTTYVACDKVVAAWLREPKEKVAPTIGFLGA